MIIYNYRYKPPEQTDTVPRVQQNFVDGLMESDRYHWYLRQAQRDFALKIRFLAWTSSAFAQWINSLATKALTSGSWHFNGWVIWFS